MLNINWGHNQGLLADILLKNKSEVIAMFLTEYDEQAQRELDREEAREEGRAEGREEGREEGRAEGSLQRLIQGAEKKMKKGISAESAADMLEESVELVQKIYDVLQAHPDWGTEQICGSVKSRGIPC